jgi:hypothetical protein
LVCLRILLVLNIVFHLVLVVAAAAAVAVVVTTTMMTVTVQFSVYFDTDSIAKGPSPKHKNRQKGNDITHLRDRS